MGPFLQIYTVLFCLSAVTGDYLIEGPRNIQKRSTDKPVDDIEVYSIDISSKVILRFAHNVIRSRAVNRANVSKEVLFDVDLPKSAFITNFSMIIDGVTYSGEIKEKEVAKKQYEKAVSKGQTAGLVRASGRKTEKFTVSVNVASQSKVTFELVYEEMLKRHSGKYEMFIKVQPKAIVKTFQIEVDLHEPQGISFLDAEATFITNDLLPAIKKSFSGEKGHVSFKPTIDQQRSCANCSTTLLNGDFIVQYDVNRKSPGNIQVVNGYFVHFFAPTKLADVPKNVIYVIDRSGSMSDKKMEQTKQSLIKILEDTSRHDYINFIDFDYEINVWKKSLMQATPENIEKAKEYIHSITSRATNINDAVLVAVQLLNKAHASKEVPDRSVSMIILLTDGEANRGEENPARIQENVKRAINGKYTLYSLGFGYSVDYAFLEKLALENSGVARRIYEDSDAALQLEGFYKEVANPTLLDIEMQYPENSVADLTQNSFRHYFEGDEIVVAGRLTDNDLNSFIVDVKAEGADKSLKYTENVQLQEKDDVQKQQEYIFGDFTERLWAYLTIQQLLEKRIYADPSEKANLTAQALDLSLKFKFVTPLTSMVVTKPEEKEKEAETLIADKFVEGQQQQQQQQAPTYVSSPSYSSPSIPIPSNWVDSDPHFVINVPHKKDAVCFNIHEDPGVVLNLIEDQELGMFNLEINKEKNVTFSFGEGATFVIILHKVGNNHPLHRDFLGFYTLDDDKFSAGVHGLLGQFFHGINYEIYSIHKTDFPEKPDATMTVKNKLLTVTRGVQNDYRKDPRNGSKVPCWFVHSNGEGLIDGSHKDYIVPDIFSIA